MRSISWYVLMLLGLLSLVYFVYGAVNLVQTSRELQKLEEHQASLIKIEYGLFNLDGWKTKVYNVFSERLHTFEISQTAYDEVNKEMHSYLKGIYKEYISTGKLFDKVFKEAEEKKSVPPALLNMFKMSLPTQIQNLNIEKQLPGMATTLTTELKKREPKIKAVLSTELDKLLISVDTIVRKDARIQIATYYAQDSVLGAINFLNEKIQIEKTTYYSKANHVFYWLLGIIAFAMIMFFVFVENRKWVIGFLSIVSLAALYVGVQLPMIVIDMRLNSFDFVLLNQTLSFDQQSIFFQSKSILDVTKTLLEGRTNDLKFVGVLVLCFSIIFPVIKLILSAFYLLIESLKNNTLVKGMIFHLGKWSMADVFVVALFMAYIGFHGLADAQLASIENNKTGFAVETVNYTRLEKGALFFTTYCILSIIIGTIIGYINQKNSNQNGTVNQTQ